MNAKRLVFGEEARHSALDGVTQLSKAVSLLLVTEVLVVEEPEPEKPAPAGMPDDYM